MESRHVVSMGHGYEWQSRERKGGGMISDSGKWAWEVYNGIRVIGRRCDRH